MNANLLSACTECLNEGRSVLSADCVAALSSGLSHRTNILVTCLNLVDEFLCY